MEKISTILPANRYENTPNLVLQVATGLCIFVCSITGCGINEQISIPNPTSFKIRPFSANVSKQKIYNNKDFNFCWDGDFIVDVDLIRSYRTIEEISCLCDNWNENNAQKFSSTLLERTRAIVETLKKQPEIFPTANESIQFEFEKNDGDYLEFELFEDGTVKKFFYSDTNGVTTEYITPDDVSEAVNKFYGF